MDKPDSFLGSPLTYYELSDYFEAFSQSDDEEKNSLLLNLLKPYNIHSILDFSCGTGAQALWFAKRGFQVTGVDLSSSLIDIAKQKAVQENLKVKLHTGDMRSTQIGQFDAVITIFNAIGHLTKAEFEIALQNIFTHLKSGGIYIFDIFNLNALTDDQIQTMKTDQEITIDQKTVRHLQRSELDCKNGFLTSHDEFMIEGNPTIKGTFSLQIYTPKELRDLLLKNGFTPIGQYGLNGRLINEMSTTHFFTVARKV